MAVTKLKTTQIAAVLAKIVTKQGGKCALCGHPFTNRDRACLDHCHDTGYIRGALHASCNGIEGRLKKLAQRGHRGISPYKYLIGLGEYLKSTITPKYNLIHPSHKSEEDKRIERNAKARAKRKANK